MGKNLVALPRKQQSSRPAESPLAGAHAREIAGAALAGPDLARRRARRSRTAPPPKKIASLQAFFEGGAAKAGTPRRIRICLLDPGLQVGGAEWFTTLLMQFSNPQIFEFVVLCYRPEPTGLQKHIESLGIKVVSAVGMFGTDLTFQQWVQRELWAMLDLERPDLLYFSSNYLYARILAEGISDRIRNYRTVVRISNFDHAELDAADFSTVAKLICCSDEQYAYMSKSYPDKAVLIKTGVDVAQFHPVGGEEKRSIREEIDLPQKTTVLFCGRLGDPLKRTWLFEQVVDQVLAQRDDIAFLVVGYFESHRNAEEEHFREFVSSRGITWRNDVRPWEMPRYYQAADLLLSVSGTGEGLSNTVLQGLASGLISLVTPASGMSELIHNGENGFILEDDAPSSIAEVLLRAVDLQEAARRALGANARKLATSHYNLRDSVHDYERVLYEIFKAMPARVTMVDGTWGIGGAEWLAALLTLSCDPSKIKFQILGHADNSELLGWLAEQGVPVSTPPPAINYDTWRDAWLPKTFRALRSHVVMPCTSTSWDLSTGSHRLLGISQNASDAEVLQRSHYERVAYLICVSEDVRSVLDQRYRYKMTVLRNSIDPEMFHRDESARLEVRHRLGLADKRVVLWCGRLSEHRKRLDILCEVMKKCLDRPELHFLVLGYFRGHQEQQEQWERFLERHPNVTWISGVRHWETPAYYSASDFYLSTSGYTGSDFEGLSLAAVQALAAGLPIVTTLSGGQREVVAEGVNGYLTRTGDSDALSARLKSLCDMDAQSLEAMRQRNIARASAEFDIRDHARRYETICWTLKNTIDAALPYDPQARTGLLEFDDAALLSAQQRHMASFFLNHISPLLRDASRELFALDSGTAPAASLSVNGAAAGGDYSEEDLLRTLAAGATAPVLEIGRASGDPRPPFGLVLLHEGLSYQQIAAGLMLAAESLAPGGFAVLRGCNSPVIGQGTAESRLLGTPACALLDHMRTHFPFWRQPYQVGSSVVLRKST